MAEFEKEGSQIQVSAPPLASEAASLIEEGTS